MKEEKRQATSRDLYVAPVLTVPEAASLLKIGAGTMYKLIKLGYIRVLRLGEMRIRRQELDRFLGEAEEKQWTLDELVKKGGPEGSPQKKGYMPSTLETVIPKKAH